MDLAESKIREPSFWQPGASTVERAPNSLEIFHNRPKIMLSPHWHAQVEVNFIMHGTVHYKMAEHEVSLSEGDMCLFWGGLPHQMDMRSDDVIYAGAHLPLVHFFRLHLPSDVPSRLMTGATLVTSATDAVGPPQFRAVEPVLALRRSRPRPSMRSTSCCSGWSGCGSSPTGWFRKLPRARTSPARSTSNRHAMSGGCAISSPGISCDEIDCVDIAAAADIHPKYAMSVFRKSTGMTLNEYVNLLRLSYAQALLMNEDANVISVAMDSGFGSLSAFNKSFRKLAGMSPSDFRKVSATR